MSDLTLKIGKLLIQAEGASTAEEAAVFYEKAQLLSSANGIDTALARKAVKDLTKRETPVQKRIPIGEPGKPLNAVFCSLFMDIGKAQELTFNIAHNSTYVIAFGFPSDIEVAEAFYANIAPQMIEMGTAYVKGGSWKGEQTWCTGTFRMKPVTSRVAKRCFYEEFISVIGRRMMAAKREAEKVYQDEHVQAMTDASTSTSLVLADKREEVRDFYKKTSNARGSWKGNRGNTANSSLGRSAGQNAGQNARLTGTKGLTGGRAELR